MNNFTFGGLSMFVHLYWSILLNKSSLEKFRLCENWAKTIIRYCNTPLFFSYHQTGYIDGPVLTAFRTNLVVLPSVMEYVQYIFIAVGLVLLISGILLHYKAKVKLLHSIKVGVCLLRFLTACGMPHSYACSPKNRCVTEQESLHWRCSDWYWS